MQLSSASRLVRWTYFLRKKQVKPTFNNEGYRQYDEGGRPVYTVLRYPESTTLCRLFWRAFVFMPLLWGVLCGSVGILLYFLGQFVLHNGMAVLTALMIISGIAASVALIVWVCRTHSVAIDAGLTRGVGAVVCRIDHTRDTIKASVFWQGLLALKSKVCPIIRITD